MNGKSHQLSQEISAPNWVTRFKFWCLIWPACFSILFALHVSCFRLCTKEHCFLISFYPQHLWRGCFVFMVHKSAFACNVYSSCRCGMSQEMSTALPKVAPAVSVRMGWTWTQLFPCRWTYCSVAQVLCYLARSFSRSEAGWDPTSEPWSDSKKPPFCGLLWDLSFLFNG